MENSAILLWKRLAKELPIRVQIKAQDKTLTYLTQRHVEIIKQIIFIKCFVMTNKNIQISFYCFARWP